MEADVTQAFENVNAQLQAILVAIQGLKGGSGGNAAPSSGSGSSHAPPEVFHGFNSADGDWSQWTDLVGNNRYFNKDYWFIGLVGAQKGVELGLWGGANTAIGMEGESKPHRYVVTLLDPQPNGGNWRLALKSVADVGWIDGSRYMPDASLTGGQKFAAWDAVGRPSVSADGFLLHRGGYPL